MSRTHGSGVVRFIRDAAGASLDESPDAELVRRYAANADEQAFRLLIARHGQVVWAVCRRMLQNHHDAEDAFQATFLVLARGAGRIRSESAVGGWLCGVAARVACRTRAARRPEPVTTEPVDGHPDGALGDLTVREAEAALYEELAHLPEKYRAALVLCCLEGLTRDEAAARLGWTANRVKSCLEQGRELLRARLTRRGIALGLALLTSLLATPAGAVPPSVAETVARYATGTPPPTAISSLVIRVSQTMWITNWKWIIAGCVALALTAGGTVAAILSEAPVTPAAPTKPGPNLVLTSAPAQPPIIKVQGEVKVPPKPAWDVAAEFLQLAIDGKTDKAVKLAEPRMIDERDVKKIQASGLKRVKLAMILINDERVMVVTERAQLIRGGGPRPEDAHVVVTLEKKPDVPWIVRESDIRDEKWAMREMGDYLEGKFNLKPDAKEENTVTPKNEEKDAKALKAEWDVATEFLKLALAEKTADALKLTVPGTISENTVGEIKERGVSSTKVVAVLFNDTRTEVAYERQTLSITRTKKAEAHPVLMLVKSKEGAWQVKDIDVRDAMALQSRVELYLGGPYDEKK
jgi:RNA polymerase sigma factor (sigma-70 family)